MSGNIQCPICGEYIPADSVNCPFCNENINQEKEEKEEKNTKINIILAVLLLVIALVLGAIAFFNRINPNISIFDSYNSQETETPKNTHDSAENIKDAIELYKAEKYDDAAVLFQQEIDFNNDPEAYYYMAEIYKSRGYTKLAIKTYKAADSYKTNYYEAKKRLAQTCFYDYLDRDEALKYGEEALQLNKQDIELLETMVDVYKSKGEIEKAISIYKDIVKIDSSNYNANLYLANYYYLDKKYREAIPYIENMLKKEYNTNVAYTLAFCYVDIEYYTKAMETLDKIIAKDSYEASYAQYLKNNISVLRDQYRQAHQTSVEQKNETISKVLKDAEQKAKEEALQNN